jgi:DNA-binding transcriptional regulator YiaG
MHPADLDLWISPADLAQVAQIRADLSSGRAKAARDAANVSLAEFAAALRVSHQAVSMWEAGTRRPSATHALAYGRLLASLTQAAA